MQLRASAAGRRHRGPRPIKLCLFGKRNGLISRSSSSPFDNVSEPMFYRLCREYQSQALARSLREVLATEPLKLEDGPLSIVSMVGKNDVLMYLVGMKSFYRHIRRGKVVVIVARAMPQKALDTLSRHIVGVEFVVLETIDTGACQRGGTWERLLYIADRSASEYVIQFDSDLLVVGPTIPEVTDCIQLNRPFTMSDGHKLCAMTEAARMARITSSDYIGIVAERQFDKYPGHRGLSYVRGSSGFTGFAHGGTNRDMITRFHQEMERCVGVTAWRKWGTEQCASNFAIANSPGAVVLPYPQFASFLPDVKRDEVRLFHFIGAHRFRDGYFAARSREVISSLKLVDS